MDPTTTTTPAPMSWPNWSAVEQRPSFRFWAVVAPISAAASAYHGYKRNARGPHAVLWAISWGILGAVFPIVTPAVALVEGFGKPLKKGA